MSDPTHLGRFTSTKPLEKLNADVFDSGTSDDFDWFFTKSSLLEKRLQDIKADIKSRSVLYQKFFEKINAEVIAVETNLEHLHLIPLNSIPNIGEMKIRVEKQLQDLERNLREEEYNYWKDLTWLTEKLREMELKTLFFSGMIEMLSKGD